MTTFGNLNNHQKYFSRSAAQALKAMVEITIQK